MTKLNQIYKCSVCGNMTQVIHASTGTLVCCGQDMILQVEKTEDVGKEKHVPVVEKTAAGVKVKIGSIPHPMEETHYIEWIQIVAGGVTQRKYLKPNDAPEAEFCTSGELTLVREYCNVHGLWRA
ncbi:MAG: desulfoferrodoxin [Candidatus Buchananbacteria bacterium]